MLFRSEDTMLDIMYDIPKSDEPRKITITRECIENHAQPKIEPLIDAEAQESEITKPNAN